MKKKLKDLTFAECKAICDKHDCDCMNCPIDRYCFIVLRETDPSNFAFEKMWDEEVEI